MSHDQPQVGAGRVAFGGDQRHEAPHHALTGRDLEKNVTAVRQDPVEMVKNLFLAAAASARAASGR